MRPIWSSDYQNGWWKEDPVDVDLEWKELVSWLIEDLKLVVSKKEFSIKKEG